MNTQRLKPWLAALIGIAIPAVCTTPVKAAAPFTEKAGDPYYDTGWEFGSSQPDNFGWFTSTSVTAPGIAGRFLGDSRNLAGGSGGDINSGGRSWGIYGQSGGTGFGQYDAYGSLKDGAGNDVGLAVGQTLAIDIAFNYRNGYKGFAARGSDGTELFTFNIGSDDHVVYNATSGTGSIGSDYSSTTVCHIALTQTSASGGVWTITRSGGVTDSDTGTYSGEIWSFKLYVGQVDGGSENDLMVNHVTVTDQVLAITDMTRLGDGTFQLNFSGTPGGKFTVLASSDLNEPLNSWAELGTAVETPAGSGRFQFIDLNPQSLTRRFYVVRSP